MNTSQAERIQQHDEKKGWKYGNEVRDLSEEKKSAALDIVSKFAKSADEAIIDVNNNERSVYLNSYKPFPFPPIRFSFFAQKYLLRK